MRIVAWDLETTDLKALMGRTLCCSFQEIVPSEYEQTGQLTFRSDEVPWKSEDPIHDRELVVAIRNELAQYNTIVGWNSKMFDLPFLNARLRYYGEAPLKPQFHLDLMYFARGNSLRIGSSKLDNVQRFFQTPTPKTPITWEHWQRAAIGDATSMDEVVTHCEADVKALSEIYWELLPMVANLHK